MRCLLAATAVAPALGTVPAHAETCHVAQTVAPGTWVQVCTRGEVTTRPQKVCLIVRDGSPDDPSPAVWVCVPV
jgi:hypothetical protein